MDTNKTRIETAMHSIPPSRSFVSVRGFSNLDGRSTKLNMFGTGTGRIGGIFNREWTRIDANRNCNAFDSPSRSFVSIRGFSNLDGRSTKLNMVGTGTGRIGGIFNREWTRIDANRNCNAFDSPSRSFVSVRGFSNLHGRSAKFDHDAQKTPVSSMSKFTHRNRSSVSVRTTASREK